MNVRHKVVFKIYVVVVLCFEDGERGRINSFEREDEMQKIKMYVFWKMKLSRF